MPGGRAVRRRGRGIGSVLVGGLMRYSATRGEWEERIVQAMELSVSGGVSAQMIGQDGLRRMPPIRHCGATTDGAAGSEATSDAEGREQSSDVEQKTGPEDERIDGRRGHRDQPRHSADSGRRDADPRLLPGGHR